MGVPGLLSECGVRMSVPTYIEVSVFYCNAALRLCQLARTLYSNGKYKEGAQICRFVSTLCKMKPHERCQEESRLCRNAADLFERGDISGGEKYCKRARSICPRNFRAFGE